MRCRWCLAEPVHAVIGVDAHDHRGVRRESAALPRLVARLDRGQPKRKEIDADDLHRCSSVQCMTGNADALASRDLRGRISPAKPRDVATLPSSAASRSAENDSEGAHMQRTARWFA